MGDPRCPGHVRHWFTVYGAPSWRTHRCVRCGAPNPRWDDIEEAMCAAFGVVAVEEMRRAVDGRFARREATGV